MKDRLEAIKLEKSYRKKKVLKGISLYVSKGEIVGLLGPNGAGKTTAFSLILGLIPQDAGQVFLDGEDITALPMYIRARKGLCLLPQEPSAFRRLSVEDNLFSIIETVGDSHSARNNGVKKILKEFGLQELAKARAFTLSGGERRRLEIARALLTTPRFMLLDEPFTGIDPLAIQDLQEIILALKNKGIGILLTDHSVREALKITDRAYIIDGGRILKEGNPQELVGSKEVRESYLGDDFLLI
ncbi:MAG: LPS export ABC transporter ATP-binding protein [Candidatus Aminicenantes bacterium]|nr:LPS export ABC transporter ATP-binding protein [Candidatus Aminicenantes bacterium]MDH5465884.1 LPS export ABC transporter ATP-binding protein [Candidatus Aminicenantes bacterium]MDH5704556.1 LPS export ABC transporter ATP-binding protein [Candidatus Aminicenantes bacterium]